MNPKQTTSLKSLLSACEQYFVARHLSETSVKLYLADIKRFLSWLTKSNSTLTLSSLTSPSSYSRYFAHLQNSGTAPSTTARSQAALRKLGKFVASTYSLPNPTENLTLSSHSSSQNSQLSPNLNYIKYFTNSLKADHLSELTIKSYKSDITRYIGWSTSHMASTKLTTLLETKNIDKYLNHLYKNTSVAPSTLDRKLASLTRFKDWYTSSYPSEHVSDSTHDLEESNHQPSVLPEETDTTASLESPRFSRFRSISLPSFLSFALLLLLISGLAFFGYRAFSQDQIRLTQAYPAITPVSPNRQLSFQGRLEDSGGTPITSSTNLTFKLFDDPSAGSELYSSGACAIAPDTDGIFSTQIGDDCGSAIGSNVFSEYANVYLEVTVVAETLTPRQQIATVAYALNSETLQGFPISSTVSAVRNTVVAMNNVGQILVGEQSPRLTGVSGTFQISAPALSLTSATGTSGNIAIAPDGTGQVNLTGNTVSTNFFNVSNAQLSTGSLITGTVANNNAGFKLLDLLSGVSPTSKFYVTDAGQTYIAGNLGIGTSNPLYKLDVSGNIHIASGSDLYIGTVGIGGTAGATIVGMNDAGFNYVIDTTVQGALGDLDTAIDTLSSSAITGSGTTNYITKWTTGGSVIGDSQIFDNATFVGIGGTAANTNPRLYVAAAGNVGIGTTEPNFLLDVRGGTETWRGIALDPSVGGIKGYGNLNFYSDYANANASSIITFSLDGTAASNEKMRIDTNGNVGIGTTDPGSYKLNVSGKIYALTQGTGAGEVLTAGRAVNTSAPLSGGGALTSDLTLSCPTCVTTSSNAWVLAGTSGTPQNIGIGGTATVAAGTNMSTTAGATGVVTVATIANPTFATSVTTPILDNAGALNIGTTNATSLNIGRSGVATTFNTTTFTASSLATFTTAASLGMTSTTNLNLGAGVTVTNSSGNFTLNANSTNNILLNTNGGNVGIGTTNPLYKLDVNIGATSAYPLQLTSSSKFIKIGAQNSTYAHFDTDATSGFYFYDAITAAGANVLLNTTGGTSYFSNGQLAVNASNAGTATLYVNGNVGIGTTTPSTFALDVVGSVQMTGFKLTTSPIVDYILTSDATGVGTWQPAPVGVGGAGTQNYIPIWTNSTTIGDSSLYETNNNVGIGGTVPATNPTLFVGANGRVGIGTTGPTTELSFGIGNKTISIASIDGTDTGSLALSGGGVAGTTRGASISLRGNEYSGEKGNLLLSAGDPATPGALEGAIRMYAGGDYRMIIANTGNVGIGNSDPGSYKLNVTGNGYFSTRLNIGVGLTTPAFTMVTGAGNNKIFVSDTSGNASWTDITSIGVGGSGTTNYLPKWTAGTTLGNSQLFDDSVFVGIGGTAPATNPRLYVNANSGYVGIGTTSPGSALDVVGTITSRTGLRSNQYGQYSTANTLIFNDAGAGYGIRLQANGTTVLTAVDGNVGIGTTAPVTQLHIKSATSTDSIIAIDTTTADAGGSDAYLSLREAGTEKWKIRSQGDSSDVLKISSASVNPVLTISQAGGLGLGYTNDPGLGSMIISGNVGIGTTNPTQKLAVVGNTLIDTSAGDLTIRNTGSDSVELFSSGSLVLSPTNNLSIYQNSVSPFTSVGAGAITNTLYLKAGNVGIGTTNPAGILHMVKEGATDVFLDRYTNNAYSNQWWVRKARGTTSTPSDVQAGDELGGFGWAGYATSGFYTGADIWAYSDGTAAGGTFPSRLTLTAGNGNLTIKSTGNVGIGTTNPLYKLDVNGDIRIASGSELYSFGSATLGNRTYTEDNYVADAQTFTASINALDMALYDVSSGSVTGSGTQYYIPRWDTSSSLTNSQLYDNGTFVGIGGTAANTNPRLYVNASTGNVGIGTTGPVALFNIVDSVGSAGTGDNVFRLESTGGTVGPTMRFKSKDGADYLLTATGSGNEGGAGNFRIYDYTGGATRLIILGTSGNVGIGTTNPLQKLDVQGNIRANGDLFLLTSEPRIIANSSLRFFTDGIGTSEQMRLTSGGNLGIGTTNPSSQLHLEKTSNTTSSLTQLSSLLTATGNQSASQTLKGISGTAIYQGTAPGGSHEVIGVYGLARINASGAGSEDYTKLIGIEGAADVTDAGGQASWIAGARLSADGGTSSGGGSGTRSRAAYGLTLGTVQTGYAGHATAYGLNLGNTIQSVASGAFNSTVAAINIQGTISATGGNNNKAYGIYLNPTLTGAQGTWSIYSASTANSYFAGNIGIGTTNPASKLHIDSAGDATTITTNTTAGTATLWNILVNGVNRGSLLKNSGGDIEWQTASGYDFNINPGGVGNVGIGTTNPTYKLDVTGTTRITSTLNLPSLAASSALYTDVSSNLTTTPPGSGTLGYWQRNGTNLAPATITDNVGIGTTGPDSLTHITGATAGDGGSFNGSGSILHLKQNTGWSGNQPWALFVEGYSYLNGFRINAADGIRALYKTAAGGQLGFAVAGDDPITFTQSASTERMRIAAGGNVGIGTTNPLYKLDVNIGATSAYPLQLTSSSKFIKIGAQNSTYAHFDTDATSGFYFYDAITAAGANVLLNTTGGTSYFSNGQLAVNASNAGTATLYVNGNVGIGTTTPSTFALDVVGSVQMTGFKLTTSPIVDYILTSDATGVGTWQPAPVGVGGAGTQNYIPIWTSSTNIGDSSLYETNNNVGIGGTVPATNPTLFVGANGRVGIGTTGPTTELSFGIGNKTISIASIDGTDTGSLALSGGGVAGTTRGASISLRGNEYSGEKGNLLLSAGDPATPGALEGAIRMYAGGDYRMIIANTGNVGIGTTNPGKLLDIAGTLRASGVVTFTNLAVSSAVYTDGSSNLTTTPPGSGILGYWQRNGTKLAPATITDNVGIGTTNPLQKLAVEGTLAVMPSNARYFTPSAPLHVFGTNVTSRTDPTVQEVLRLSQSNTFSGSKGSHFSIGLSYWQDAGNNYPRTRVDFKTTGRTTDSETTPNTVMSLRDDGNVGIGTTTPGYNLDVSGTGRFTSTLTTTGISNTGAFTTAGGIANVNVSSNYATNINTGTSNGAVTLGGNSNTVQINSSNWDVSTAGAISGLTGYTQSSGNFSISGTGTFGTGTGAISLNGDTTIAGGKNLSLASGTGVFSQTFTGTTTTASTISSNSLTTGKALYLSSTSNALSTGSLLSLDWSPGSSTTATGDLFSLNIGANGTIGNLFNILDSGSSLFSVSETTVTSNLPTSFTSAGDVSIAYDLLFTNSTASYIKSSAPLYVQAGESFESNDLTLQTYNYGDVVLDTGIGTTSAGGTIKFYDSNVKGATVTTPIAFADASSKINTYRANYTDETLIGALNEVYSMASGLTGGVWTDGGTYIYPTDAGNYGGTGLQITDAGNLLLDGTLTVDGTSTLTGLATMTAGFDSNAASTVTSLTIDGAATTALNISNTGVTTDINLQYGETIDNDVDGSIRLGSTTLTLNGTTTLTASSLATFTTAASLGMTSTTNLNLGAGVTVTNSSGNFTLNANSTSNILLNSNGGNVGIGTTNPSSGKLQIDAGASGIPLFVKGGTSSWVIFERNSKQLYVNANYSDLNNSAQISPASASNMGISISSREVLSDLYINTSGNVGIGTTNPGAYKLNVSGGNTYLSADLVVAGGDITGANGEYIDIGEDSNGDIRLHTDSDATDYLRFDLDTNSYPEIHGYVNGGATLVEFPTGLYVSGSTFYATNVAQMRGGIQDDGGDLQILDNLDVTGVIYDSNSDVQIADHLDPSAASTYDLGDATNRWRYLYVNDICFDGGTDCASSTNSFSGPWTLSGNNLYPDLTTYNVGIGTTNPGAKLDVTGETISGALYRDNYLTSIHNRQAYYSFDGVTIDTTEWDNTATVTQNEKLTAAAGPSTWNDGIISKAVFHRSHDLVMEVDVTPTVTSSSWLMIGWHNNNTTYSYAQLAHSIYFEGGGAVRIYEDGTNIYNPGTTWTVGQKYRLRIVLKAAGGASYYSSTDGGRNWTTLWTGDATATTTPVKVGFSYYAGTFEVDNWEVYSSAGPNTIYADRGNVSEIAGNVGIGTANPGYKLDVAGTGRFTSTLNVDSTATIAGTGTALTLSGASTTAINISNTGVTTDINLQNGETIDNNTDGTILLTATTTQTSGDIYAAGNDIDAAASNNYVKFGMWGSGDSTYGIGMYSGQSLGYLNDYAMTFQMSNTAARGWVWRDDGDAASDGAMSLTTDGRLYVKSTAAFNGSVGIGTTNPGAYKLYVSGGNIYGSADLVLGGDATIGGGDITISKSGTDSDIIFPAQTNDAGYIKHYESSNTARMYFNVSDDSGTNDYFAFGYSAAVETAKIASGGSAAFTGSIHTGDNSLAYTYNRFGAAGTNNYAVDAADVYVQHDLEVDGTIYGNVSGTITDAQFLVADDNRTISPSEISANRLKFGFTSYTNNSASPWADYLHFRSYGDSSGGNDNLLVINKSTGLGMRLYQQAWGSATPYSTYKDLVLADNSPSANYITKYSGTGNTVSVKNSILYDDGTNVGIGIVSPSTHIQIYSNDTPENASAVPLGAFSIKSSASTAMVMGVEAASPYEGWIQVRHGTAAGSTYPLSLQPLGNNVGIGTTNPGYTLDIQGASGLHVGNGTYDSNIVFGNNGSWLNGIRSYDNGQVEMRIWTQQATGEIVLANGYNGNQSTTLPTDGLWVKNNLVGLGNFSSVAPAVKFQIEPNFTNLGGRLLGSNNTGWYADGRTPQMVISSSTTDTRIGTLVGLDLHNDSATDNTYAPMIMFSRRSASTSYNSAYAAIGAKATGSGPDANWVKGNLIFSTANPSGYTTGLVERMTIDSLGNVGIGTTNPLAGLHVGTGGTPGNTGANDVYIQNDLEVDGTIYGSISPVNALQVGQSGRPGYSCLDILRQVPGAPDGNYYISPDGITTYQVYCDMTTDGGGWTFLGHVNSNSGVSSFFTAVSGSYQINRADNGAVYSLGLLNDYPDTELMATLDTADPVTANAASKIVFYKYGITHTGFQTGPIACSGLVGPPYFQYKTSIGGAYVEGGTSNSCDASTWYSRTVGNAAYLTLFHSSGLGHYWGAGMGGDNSWYHDGWWYFRETSTMGGSLAIGAKDPGTSALAVMGGNVGIGTTNPGYNLQVQGTGYYSSTLTVAGTGTALTLSGAATTALNISNTGVTTDINLQNGETIDNNTDGTILLTATTSKTSGNLYVGTSGTGTVTSGLINGQTISSAANFTGSLTVAGETYLNGTVLEGDSKTMFRYSDSYLRLNEDNDFSSGIWLANSNLLGGSGYRAFGSNGGTTNSDIWIKATYDGTNDINIDGDTGRIALSGAIRAGSATATAYNHFGSGGTVNYAVDAADVYIQHDLEVDGTIYGNISGTADAQNITLVTTGNTVVTGNNVTNSGNGGWASQAYSKDGYDKGAYVSAVVPSLSHSSMFGLNTDPATDASYCSIDYAWYITSGTNGYIYESCSNVASGITLAAGDVLAVTYDGVNVKYLQNGVVRRTVAATITNPLYFDSSYANAGLSSTFSKLQIGAMNADNWVNTTGDSMSGRLNFGSDGTTPYNNPTGLSTGMSFGGFESSSLRTYGVFTELENVGGNYTKLTLNWHTGVRIGAYWGYGGIRFYDNYAPTGNMVFSVAQGDSNVRVTNNLLVGGTISDSNSDVQIADHLDPSAASTYDLGDATNRWRYLYVNDICFDGGSDCASSTNAFSGPWTLSGNNLYPDSTAYNVGIGNAAPTAKLDVTGYVKSKTGYLDRNMLDTTVWTISSGSIGDFGQNGSTAENDRIWSTDPLGRPAIIWRSINDAGSDADGGWGYSNIPVSANKAYRASVWIKKSNTSSGTVYLGADGGNTLNLNGTPNTNPYYLAFGSSSLVANRWYLLVGYMHANNDASVTSYTGVYDGVTGQKILNGTDFKNTASATAQTHRTYNYYDTTTGSIQYFANPRFEEINGTEPSIESLLGAYQGATNATDSYFGGNLTVAGSGTHSFAGTIDPANITTFTLTGTQTLGATYYLNNSGDAKIRYGGFGGADPSSSWPVYVSGNTYSSGVIRGDGGFQVDGNTSIDANNRYYYTSNTSANKWGAVNSSGWGIDALNSGDWDILVYESETFTSILNLGYSGSAILRSYDTNEALSIRANGTGNINIMDSGTGDVNIDSNTLYVDNSADSVGIGTTPGSYKLFVNGETSATKYWDGGTPYYVDPANSTSAYFAGNMTVNGAFTLSSNGNNAITLNAGTASVMIGAAGAGKLDAATIDPPYTIGGNKYATYVASMTGIKEETTGKVTTSEYVSNVGYRSILDFASATPGSDLWLFANTTALSTHLSSLVVLLSPSDNTSSWYRVNGSKLEIYSSSPTTISYRLTAPRFDSTSWSNTRDPNSGAGLVINDVVDWSSIDLGAPLALLNLSDLVISPNTQASTTSFNLYNKSTNAFITETKALASAVIANLRAGLVQTKTLETNLISPLTSKQPIKVTAPVVIQSSDPTTPTLTVEGTIDTSTISARVAKLKNIEADNITAKNIVADTISANHIEGLDAKIASISAQNVQSLSDSEITTITDRIKARLSELTNPPTAADIPLPQEATTAATLTTNYILPTTASDSATLAMIDADFVTINNYLAVIGQATMTTLTVNNMLYANSIQSKCVTPWDESGANYPSGVTDTCVSSLALQPFGGSVKLASNTLIVDSTGQVFVNGDLTVTGKILADSAELNSLTLGTPADASASATPLGQLLTIYNEQGIQVASIDASGSANLASVSTQLITIAAASDASQSASASALVQTLATSTKSNATAGSSTLTSPNLELTIESKFITADSLVYLTPTSATYGKVLYVKAKNTCPTSLTATSSATPTCTPSFTVGIDTVAPQNITFNWWIIQLGGTPN